MADFLKIGGQYFQATQDVFLDTKKNDIKTKAISASLIISWFTVIVPLFCAVLYGIDHLKGRCKSQVSNSTISQIGTKAQSIIGQPPTNLPQDLESYENYNDYLSLSRDNKFDKYLQLKTSSANVGVYYSQDALVGHVKALLSKNYGYTRPGIAQFGIALTSDNNTKISKYLGGSNNVLQASEARVPPTVL